MRFKSHNREKYLIDITPQGTIAFISRGYGGRTSDKLIVQDSGDLNNRVYGDLGLATVDLQFMKLLREDLRALARVRVHVERVIGAVQQRFSFLKETLNHDMRLCDSNHAAVTDKTVHICCALYKSCISVVPIV